MGVSSTLNARHATDFAFAYFRRRRKPGPASDFTNEVVLSFLISCVIVVATAHLILVEVRDFFLNPLASADAAIHSIFGMIMTVLIALGVNCAGTNVLHRKSSIVRLRAVILVTLFVMARTFIIVDFAGLEPLAVFGLACVVLALGLVYGLVGEQDCNDAPLRRIRSALAESFGRLRDNS